MKARKQKIKHIEPVINTDRIDFLIILQVVF